jgi:RimJ/RimL family protein N-acetyltransferase
MNSGRVELRPATPRDLGYLRELARDPEVEPFLAPGGPLDERLEEMLSEWPAAGGAFGLFVIEVDSGETAGALALQQGSAHSRICNLRQLMVDPAVRRSGVGTTAVRLACRLALVECGQHRVQTETYGDNLAAQRLFERAGFVREGVRRLAYWRRDRWLDGVLYGILAEELREIDATGG